ncbi:hypothetical protein PFICI_12882 [Pestalotiopsis fici W106-1]|uniref:N-acetyltransferase domain-containing protein n=1 Tax=Pestalotiopsis fici (strain W106-1 / CGMCC3.15140) TaxID=1229662 RepID=W3WPZ8_PESFW|nr:uncharacterized protein PFICI_12882 [Pestalotiopsis fici W106-1]ETS75938.1 hypothetical protein PFICI_12882 [Pestalotiopsis fici W106-1]
MALTFLPRSPHLKLACAKLHDVPELVSLWYRVFESPDIRALWPDTPGVRQWWDATIRHDMLGRPQEKYLKVVDTAQRGGGSIVAWMKWSLQTAEERGPRYIPWHQDMDVRRNAAFFEEIEKSRDRLVGGGRYNFYADMLAVQPEYRKLGLGLALMKWGCAEADVEKVPIYLDGTEAGSRVFTKLGFVSHGMTMGLNSMVREPENLGAPSTKL